LVEPYVSVVGVNDLALSDDVVPLSERGGRSCQKSNAVMVAKNAQEVQLQWTVGGAISIDNTEIWYAKWDDIPEDQLNCLMQPTTTEGFIKGAVMGANNGTGVFSRAGAHPRPGSFSHWDLVTDGPVFTGKITIPEGLKTLDQLVVIVSARVDQEWAKQPGNLSPDKPPQSHVVNARTNPNWHHESAGKVIQGRLDWFSIPLTIVIGDFNDSVGTQGEHLVDTVEMYSRFGEGSPKGGMRPKSAGQEQLWFPLELWEGVVVLVLVFALCLCCCIGRRSGGRKKDSDHTNEDDEFIFESKPYSDRTEEDPYDSDGEVELPEIA
jgi:hypothetical protein